MAIEHGFLWRWIMVSRAEIVAEAKTWKDTPYQHQQRLKGIATDCLGLIGGVALALGLPGAQQWADDPAYHCYGPIPDSKLLVSGCDQYMDRVSLDQIDIGDVLVMSFERRPQHFGIVSQVNPMYVIHAYNSVGKVVENGITMARVRVLRAYRYRGVYA